MREITFLGFSLYQYLWFFIIYAFLGWLLEVVFCSVDTGKFVNRGFLNGPVCPIYGVGGCIVIALLTPISHNIVLLYVCSVVLTSGLELVAGYILKKLFHTSWWDYSGEPFNLGGYICLKFSLAWGLACIVLMKAVHPPITMLVNVIPYLLGGILLAVFYAIFFSDLVVTVLAILKLNRDLGEMTHLVKELHKGSDKIAQSVGNRAISVADKIEEWDLPAQKKKFTEKLEENKDKIEEAFTEKKENAMHALQDGREKLEKSWEQGREKWRAGIASLSEGQKKDVLKPGARIRKRLVRAFPNMKNLRDAEALAELKKLLPTDKAGAGQDADKPAADATEKGTGNEDATSKQHTTEAED